MTTNGSAFNKYNLDVTVTETNLESDVKRIIETIHPEWVRNFGDELKVRELNGGISNKLFACFPKSYGLDSTETLLVRVYGKDSEKFIDRDEEIATIEIIKDIGLGPKFYCRFANGICYEYLPGSIVDHQLVTDPEVYPKIADSVARLHLANFKGRRTQHQLEPNEKPFILWKIGQLLDLIREDYSANMTKMTADYLKKTPSLAQLREELEFLKEKTFQ